MVPIRDTVKAEIVRGGSGKTDYRYHSKTECDDKRLIVEIKRR